MKKFLSVTIAVLMAVSLLGMAACKGDNGGNNQTETTTDENGSVTSQPETGTGTTAFEPVTMEPGDKYVGGWESFTLTADKTTVSPGDTVTVTLHAENCKNVACFDVLITASDALTDAAGKEKDPGEFITTVNHLTDGIQFSAIIATTGSIDALDMMTVTYTVSPDAVPGDRLTVEAEFTQYLVGTDESGDDVADATSLISVEPLTLTVS